MPKRAKTQQDRGHQLVEFQDCLLAAKCDRAFWLSPICKDPRDFLGHIQRTIPMNFQAWPSQATCQLGMQMIQLLVWLQFWNIPIWDFLFLDASSYWTIKTWCTITSLVGGSLGRWCWNTSKSLKQGCSVWPSNQIHFSGGHGVVQRWLLWCKMGRHEEENKS